MIRRATRKRKWGRDSAPLFTWSRTPYLNGQPRTQMGIKRCQGSMMSNLLRPCLTCCSWNKRIPLVGKRMTPRNPYYRRKKRPLKSRRCLFAWSRTNMFRILDGITPGEVRTLRTMYARKWNDFTTWKTKRRNRGLLGLESSNLARIHMPMQLPYVRVRMGKRNPSWGSNWLGIFGNRRVGGWRNGAPYTRVGKLGHRNAPIGNLTIRLKRGKSTHACRHWLRLGRL